MTPKPPEGFNSFFELLEHFSYRPYQKKDFSACWVGDQVLGFFVYPPLDQDYGFYQLALYIAKKYTGSFGGLLENTVVEIQGD